MNLPSFAAVASILLFLHGEHLKIGAAISLRDALSELANRHEKAGRSKIEWVFGSSGQLVEQARQGAPLDAIFVASREFATLLETEKLVGGSSFVVVAGNRIVLAAPKSARSSPKSFDDLSSPRVKRIAIGDPATVPVGDYAMQVLHELNSAEGLKDKLVYGTNARQVLAYLQSGEVDAGIIFSTDAASAADAVQVIQLAEESWHKPIEYLAAPLRNGKNEAKVTEFIEFLCTAESQACFAQMGFLPRGSQNARSSSQPTSRPVHSNIVSPESPPSSRPAGARP